MNFAYFRISKYTLEKTIKNVKENALKAQWKVLGEVSLPDNNGKMILICRPEWVGTLVKENHQLLGFLPCAITVFDQKGQVHIGTGQPAVIKALAQSHSITRLADEAEKQIKDLIHVSAGIGDLKPTNVKVYATTTCPYCTMEKSWLTSKGIKHDVVLVDMDQREAEAMVQKTGQMGVPVTEIQYEDGEPEYIVGFDQPRLASLLGITQ